MRPSEYLNGILFINNEKNESKQADFVGQLNINGTSENLAAWQIEQPDCPPSLSCVLNQKISFKLNLNDKDGNEKRPDYVGMLSYAGKIYNIAGWVKQSTKGTSFLSLKAQKKEENANEDGNTERVVSPLAPKGFTTSTDYFKQAETTQPKEEEENDNPYPQSPSEPQPSKPKATNIEDDDIPF